MEDSALTFVPLPTPAQLEALARENEAVDKHLKKILASIALIEQSNSVFKDTFKDVTSKGDRLHAEYQKLLKEKQESDQQAQRLEEEATRKRRMIEQLRQTLAKVNYGVRGRVLGEQEFQSQQSALRSTLQRGG